MSQRFVSESLVVLICCLQGHARALHYRKTHDKFHQSMSAIQIFKQDSPGLSVIHCRHIKSNPDQSGYIPNRYIWELLGLSRT